MCIADEVSDCILDPACLAALWTSSPSLRSDSPVWDLAMVFITEEKIGGCSSSVDPCFPSWAESGWEWRGREEVVDSVRMPCSTSQEYNTEHTS